MEQITKFFDITETGISIMEDVEFVVHDYLFSELHLLEIFLKIRI